MASTLSPFLATRRGISTEQADSLRGRLLSARAARTMGLVDEVLIDEKETRAAMAEAIDSTRALDHPPTYSRSITKATLSEVNVRIIRAIRPEAVTELLLQLRGRFGDLR